MLMVFCLLFVVSYNDVDNIKFMYYWYALTSVIIAIWINKLAGEHKQNFLAVLLVIFCTFSGILTIQTERRLTRRIFSNSELDAAEFIKTSLPAKALFITSQVHNQPVLCLTGRPILLGFDFWIKSHGYNNSVAEQRKNAINLIYSGNNTAFTLLENNNVDYIYVGPDEKNTLKADSGFLGKHFAVAYQNKDITIFNARQRL